MRILTSIHKLAVAATIVASVPAVMAGNYQWGGLSSQNWSDGNSWNAFPAAPVGSPPGVADVVYFEDQLYFSGFTNATKQVNNIVDANMAVTALNYSALSYGGTNHFYTTLIPSGVTLTAGGGGASTAAISVGDVYNSGGWNYYPSTWTNYSTILGGGTLNLSDPSSEICIGTYQRATLDLSGLSNVVANLNQVWVGVQPSLTYAGANYGPAGWLMLGATNTITTTPNLTAPGVVVGSLAVNYQSYPSDLLLGGNTTFNTDGILVGGYRSGSSVYSYMMFGGVYSNSAVASTFKLRGSDGVRASSVFSIGDMTSSWQGYDIIPNSSSQTAYYAAGTADFTGGVVDMLINNLYVGRACVGGTNNVTSYGVGTFIAERGTITVTNVYLGYKPTSTNSSYVSSGTLILKSNLTMNVVKDLSLYYRTNGSTSGSSTLMVSNLALLNVGGSITCTDTIGSTVTAHAVVLGGGTINLTGNGSVTAPNLLGFGTITNASSITVTNALSMNNDTLAGVGTLNLASNVTLGAAVKLTFTVGNNNAPGGLINDYLNISGNATFNNNPVTLLFSGQPVAGDYHLIDYSGTASGSLVFPSTGLPRAGLTGHQPGSGWAGFTAPTPTPANLVWNSSVTNKWTATNSGSVFGTNWLNGVAMDKFYQFDNIVFAGPVAGISTNVVLDGVLDPSSITINAGTNYAFSGTGKISGAPTFNINQNATNTFFFAATGGSDLSTPINVNAGIIKFTSSSTLAGGNGGVVIGNGAALDLNGSSFPTTAKIAISGNGVGTNGAIYTSANGSSSLTNISLNADSTMGLWISSYKIGMNAAVSSTISASLNLNGNTLNLAGTNAFMLQWANVGNGNINVYPGGNLWVYNCNIAGSGSINLPNGSTLNLWDSSGYNPSTLGAISKSLTVSNAVFQNNNSQAFYATTIPDYFNSTISLQGALTLIPTYQPMSFSGVISGPGSLIKNGTNNVIMTAANTYTGATMVNLGVITLSGAGALASTNVVIASGAVLDVTGLAGGYTSAAGQILQVDGTANGNITAGANSIVQGLGTNNGSLTLAAGGTLAVGSASLGGALTMVNDLTINGGTNLVKWGGPDDLIFVGGNLNINAPVFVRVSPVGPLNGRHVLYQYAGTSSGAIPANFTFQSSRPFSAVLDTSVAGQVAVIISGSPLLTWDGGAPSAPIDWDANITTNWLNAGNLDIFQNGDSVQFDDTAATNLVNVPTSVQAGGVAFANSTTPYTFIGAGGITAGSMTTSGGASVTFSNAGNTTLTGSGLALNAGTLTLSQPSNTTLTAKISGGGLAKTGTNILTMVGSDSSAFTGAFNIGAGTVKLGSANVLGASATTVAGGATLDVNGLSSTNATIYTSGAGTDGNGAINNRSATIRSNALNNISFNGDTTLGATGARWDVSAGGTGLQGNNFKLTKVTANDIWIKTLSDTGLGDIDVQAGRLIFAGNGTLLGNTSSNILVRTNAAIGFANGLQDLGSKNVTVAAGGKIYAVGGTNQFNGTIVLSNGLVQSEGLAQLTLGGNLSGPAQLLIQGVSSNASGTVTLSGTNTYTGGTLLNDGLLYIANSASIPANTNVVVSSRIPYNNGPVMLGLLTNVVSPASSRLIIQTIMPGSSLATAATFTGDGSTWGGPISLYGTNDSCAITFAAGPGGLTINGAIDATGFTANTNFSANGGLSISGNSANVTTLQGNGVVLNSPLVIGGLVQFPNWQDSGGTMTKLVLNASGNDWGQMYIQNGLIQIGADNAIAPNRLLTVANGARISGSDDRFVIDLNGHNQALGNFVHGGGALDTATWIGNSSTTADSVLSYVGAATNTWSAFILDAFDTTAPVQHKTGLTVTSGTLRLVPSGTTQSAYNAYFYTAPGAFTNLYSGPTLVSGGVLEMDSFIPNSTVTVNGSGILAGIGRFDSAVTIGLGGTLSPGTNSLGTNRIGTLKINNNLTFNAGANAYFKINLTSNLFSQVVGINNLTYGGGLNITITNLGAQAITGSTVLPLFSAASYAAGTVTVSPLVPAPGLIWDTSYLATDGTLRVSTVNTNSPTMATAKTGNSLTLSWPADHAGWRLQVQTNSASTGLNNNWATVPGSTNAVSVTVPVVSGNQTVFYRLVYP